MREIQKNIYIKYLKNYYLNRIQSYLAQNFILE